METYLGTDVDIREVGPDAQIIDQAWRLIHR